MNEIIIAIIIGIVEGLTEFLPISSTGHMILVGSLLGFEGEKAAVFSVFIQLGAILSVLILYWDKFLRLLDFRSPIGRRELTPWHVAAGIVPVLGIGFFLHKPIKAYLFSPFTVIIGLVAGSILMLAAEKIAKRPQTRELDEITLRQAFFVGLFQILSLWPGFSRSGSTIAGGLLFSMSRKAAAEFSFIIAVPIMAIACVYDLLKIWSQLNTNDLAMLAVGFVTAFIVAWLSIIWFLRFLNRSTLTSFAYYRLAVAALSYYWFFGR
ncbi:undecaprenyl pyrophosphate phosphatase [Acetonema longum DSM 6540]|uniref:Undecaprenyl-diphosphatase n=1 Tax=Acetonema longum DSM 6540 TaxID=1009370 RepID=F7NMY8_9FIRM|nr:undecaprenyl pyrophosphate phosphatase [Acetonema longum DSM 6540]